MTRPWRLIIRHFSHIFLTDGLTFIAALSLSFVTIRYPASIEIVGRQLHHDSVSGQDPDVVHPHLAGNVSQYFVAVVEFDPKHGVGKGFYYLSLNLNSVFLLGQAVPFLNSKPS
jgi:hypothetical protein